MKAQDVLVIFQWGIIFTLSIVLASQNTGCSNTKKEIVPVERIVLQPPIERVVYDTTEVVRLENINTSLYNVITKTKESLRNAKNELDAFKRISREELVNVLAEKNRQLKGKDSKINQLTSIVDQLKVTVTTDAQKRDTIINKSPRKVFTSDWKDPDGWADINTLFINDDDDKGTFRHTLKVNNQYSIIQYSDKGKDYIEVVNHNPYAEIKEGTNIFSIDAKQEKDTRRWSVGLQVGAYLTPRFRIEPCLGLGVNYRLFKIGKE